VRSTRTSRSAAAEPAYHAGRIAFEKGEFAEAVERLAEAAQILPGTATLELLGESLLELGRFDEAIPWLEQAALEAPKSFRARYLLGRALRRAGKSSAAARSLRQALAINPHYRKAREELDALLPDAPHGLEES
jgi:protein O-GlcNAc transferase